MDKVLREPLNAELEGVTGYSPHSAGDLVTLWPLNVGLRSRCAGEQASWRGQQPVHLVEHPLLDADDHRRAQARFCEAFNRASGWRTRPLGSSI
jgi:hypothetical protein